LGHLFGGLGDEYYTSEVTVQDFYPEGIEPLEPNLTTLVDFDKKWRRAVAESTPIPTPDTPEYNKQIGAFEGGGYTAKGVYRPYRSCTMKEGIYNAFCPVCTKVMFDTFNYYDNTVVPADNKININTIEKR